MAKTASQEMTAISTGKVNFNLYKRLIKMPVWSNTLYGSETRPKNENGSYGNVTIELYGS